MNKLIIVLLSSIIMSCNPNSTKLDKSENRIENMSDLVSEPDIDIRLAAQKMITDSTIIKTNTPIRYVLFDEKQRAKQVDLKNTEIDDYESQYLIYSDSTKIIKAIKEIPFSQSGDWYIEQTHYFDNKGKTFGLQKQFNTFHHDESCGGDSPIFVNTIQLYNQGKLIIKRETVRDINKKNITKDSCSYNKIDIPIYSNLSDLLNAAKIDLKIR